MNDSDTSFARKTYSYKTVSGRDLELDVIGAEGGGNRPCVLWIHGGGLIFGSRANQPKDSLLREFAKRGITVVSVDHRLAPEAKLADIFDDVCDAWRWVIRRAPEVAGVDPSRAGIAGASSGAYMALMAGYACSPAPRAIGALWGFGDITEAWEAEPSEHYRSMGLVSREDALASLGASPTAGGSGGDRSLFYLYCRQQGLWLEEVAGHDPKVDPVWFDRFCPARNIRHGYPPTVLVHGTEDADVPYRQSEVLVQRMGESGVEHHFVSLPGVGHGFAGAPPELIQSTEAAVAEFFLQRLVNRA